MTAAARSGAPRVRDALLADHRELEDLLGQVLVAFEGDDRQQVAAVWALFDPRLLSHLETEERHLIPALRRTDEPAARALLEEHEHIRRRLMQLGTEVDLHCIRLAEARAFAEELRKHADHEEATLYSWAEEHVDASERTSVLALLRKSRLQPRGSRES